MVTDLQCDLCQKLDDISASLIWRQNLISDTKFATSWVIFFHLKINLRSSLSVVKSLPGSSHWVNWKDLHYRYFNNLSFEKSIGFFFFANIQQDYSLTHPIIYASVNQTIIGSDNSLSLVWHQTIIWWWLIFNWIPGNKLQWNFNQNWNIFIQENKIIKNVVCEMVATSSWLTYLGSFWFQHHKV